MGARPPADMYKLSHLGKQQLKFSIELKLCDVQGLPDGIAAVAVAWDRGGRQGDCRRVRQAVGHTDARPEGRHHRRRRRPLASRPLHGSPGSLLPARSAAAAAIAAAAAAAAAAATTLALRRSETVPGCSCGVRRCVHEQRRAEELTRPPPQHGDGRDPDSRITAYGGSDPAPYLAGSVFSL